MTYRLIASGSVARADPPHARRATFRVHHHPEVSRYGSNQLSPVLGVVALSDRLGASKISQCWSSTDFICSMVSSASLSRLPLTNGATSAASPLNLNRAW
jgi:hypothetical protein